MKTTAFLSTLLAIATLGQAAPAASPNPSHSIFPLGPTCTAPLQRKEWRTLTTTEKNSYFDAVKCLHAKPADLTSVAPGSGSRFEDFVAEHQRQTSTVHWVAHFLPWHRLFLHWYEKELRTCGMTIGLPYWDYSIDSGNLLGSPVLADFGGDGVFDPAADRAFGAMGGGCIPSGPFTINQTNPFIINLGQTANNQADPHCINRNVKNLVGQVWLNPQRRLDALALPTFQDFATTLEGTLEWATLGVHSAGHFALSGVVGDMYTSPADPIFYLHHANLDRIWAEWQALAPANKFALGGSIKPRTNDLSPPDVPDITLNNWFPINLGRLGGLFAYTTVGRILDTKGTVPAGHLLKGNLCYEYV